MSVLFLKQPGRYRLQFLSLYIACVLLLWSSVSTTESVSSQQTCSSSEGEDAGTCTTTMEDGNEVPALPPSSTKFTVTIINESRYRADLYYDDGRFGKNLLTVESRGGTATVSTYVGHKFFVTRHGVKERLFNLETDTPYTYTIDSYQLVIPADAAPSSNPCQDRYSVCPAEAANGECTRNPGWMIVHCCQACKPYINSAELVDPKIRCTREHLNMTGPVWAPGDLERLFQSWSTDPKYQKYQPRVLSSPHSTPITTNNVKAKSDAPAMKLPPWVMVFDEFLTPEEADALIEGGRKVGFERSTDQGKTNSLGEQERVVSQSRTSSNAWCTGQCEMNPTVQRVTKRIEEFTGIPKANYEQFQILEYEPGQYYRAHHDSSRGSLKKLAGPRVLTFFLYLSEVEDGGATYFPRLELGVAPKKGRALIWPSVRDDDPADSDPRMTHEAQVVNQGIKYAANHWIHLYDFNTPNKWGCTGSFS